VCSAHFNSRFPFGTYFGYYLIKLENLTFHVKSIASYALRSSINTKLDPTHSKFYCNGVEFYRGVTVGVDYFDTSFNNIIVYGIKWGSYMSECQMRQTCSISMGKNLVQI
jgi:hypothetical protein